MLKAKLGGWKLAFTDTERRRLAIRAKALGRKLLGEIDTLVTPDTLLRWHRELVAHVLRENGIDPAPLQGKRTQWSTFLKARWKILVASHIFSIEVWRLSGLTTYDVLFFIQLSTRTVKIAGITTNPDAAWMLQSGRNMTDMKSGLLLGKGKLIIDRDTKYCKDFRQLLKQSGTTIIRLPPRSRN